VAKRLAERGEEVPAPVRRILGFAKLAGPARRTLRAALEDDDAFRDHVAEGATEAEVGRAGWLFLVRPDGWEAELDDLVDRAGRWAQASAAARDERRAERRLAGLERRAEAAERRAEDLQGELAGVRAELEDRRAGQRALLAELTDARARADEEADGRRRAVEALAEAREQAAAGAADLGAARRRLRELQAGAGSVDLARVTAAASRLGAVVAEAAGAVAELDAAVAAASPPARSAPDPQPPSPPAPPPAASDAGGTTRARRRAPAIPGGMFDDSPEAAAHLLRRAGACILVDGYNVTKLAWPDEPPAEQRARLHVALDDLGVRSGCRPEVVWDGAEQVTALPAPLLRDLRVHFSAPDVEADDVVLDLVDAVPAGVDVVVVSNDRRVRDGARARGAAAVRSEHLLAVLGIGAR